LVRSTVQSVHAAPTRRVKFKKEAGSKQCVKHELLDDEEEEGAVVPLRRSACAGVRQRLTACSCARRV